MQVVPEYSAVLGLPNEMILPLNAHHRGMCRYPSAKDQDYVLVEASIKEMISGKSTASGKIYIQMQFLDLTSYLNGSFHALQLPIYYLGRSRRPMKLHHLLQLPAQSCSHALWSAELRSRSVLDLHQNMYLLIIWYIRRSPYQPQGPRRLFIHPHLQHRSVKLVVYHQAPVHLLRNSGASPQLDRFPLRQYQFA